MPTWRALGPFIAHHEHITLEHLACKDGLVRLVLLVEAARGAAVVDVLLGRGRVRVRVRGRDSGGRRSHG
jgi:hypothetical protein